MAHIDGSVWNDARRRGSPGECVVGNDADGWRSNVTASYRGKNRSIMLCENTK